MPSAARGKTSSSLSSSATPGSLAPGNRRHHTVGNVSSHRHAIQPHHVTSDVILRTEIAEFFRQCVELLGATLTLDLLTWRRHLGHLLHRDDR